MLSYAQAYTFCQKRHTIFIGYAVYSQGNTIPAVVDKIHAKHTLIKASEIPCNELHLDVI